MQKVLLKSRNNAPEVLVFLNLDRRHMFYNQWADSVARFFKQIGNKSAKSKAITFTPLNSAEEVAEAKRVGGESGTAYIECRTPSAFYEAIGYCSRSRTFSDYEFTACGACRSPMRVRFLDQSGRTVCSSCFVSWAEHANIKEPIRTEFSPVPKPTPVVKAVEQEVVQLQLDVN